MKVIGFILVLSLLGSCSSRSFIKEKVCSPASLKYLSHPRNKTKQALSSPGLTQEMQNTQSAMQLCYEDFKSRTGQEEFQTCLVVGVDRLGKREYFDFSSQETPLDLKFMNCAQAVIKKVPYPKFGRNYILIQSYNFYNP